MVGVVNVDLVGTTVLIVLSFVSIPVRLLIVRKERRRERNEKDRIFPGV